MSCTNTCESNEIQYKGDGASVLFTFPFTYIDEADVKVSLWDEPSRRWVYTTAWSFANATTIQFNTAPPAPDPEDTTQFNIRIGRCTPIDPLAANFYPGSTIRAEDLNANFEQLQLAIEEGRCQVPEWLFSFLDSYYWNKEEETTYTDDVWVDESDDKHIPTTGAVQQELVERWDKRTETTYIPDNWVSESDDNHVPTTGAVQQELVERWDKRTETTYINDDWDSEADDNHVPTTGAVDKHIDEAIQDNYDVRSVTRPEQIADGGINKINDTHYFTTAASAQRHDVYHQDPKPSDLPYEQPGKMWFDTATLGDYLWDSNAGAWVDMENSGPVGPQGDFGPPGKVIISDNPPTEYPALEGKDARPLASGDLWWSSAKVNLYVYYIDNASSQWVSVSKVGPKGQQGPAGKDGQDGQDGKDGQNGQDGQDGAPGTGGGPTYTFTAPLKETVGAVSIDLQTINSTP